MLFSKVKVTSRFSEIVELVIGAYPTTFKSSVYVISSGFVITKVRGLGF